MNNQNNPVFPHPPPPLSGLPNDDSNSRCVPAEDHLIQFATRERGRCSPAYLSLNLHHAVAVYAGFLLDLEEHPQDSQKGESFKLMVKQIKDALDRLIQTAREDIQGWTKSRTSRAYYQTLYASLYNKPLVVEDKNGTLRARLVLPEFRQLRGPDEGFRLVCKSDNCNFIAEFTEQTLLEGKIKVKEDSQEGADS